MRLKNKLANFLGLLIKFFGWDNGTFSLKTFHMIPLVGLIMILQEAHVAGELVDEVAHAKEGCAVESA